MVSAFISDHHKDWDEKLPMLAFAYNTASHSVTKSSPYELLFGRRPKVPIDLIYQSVKLELYLTPKSFAMNLKRTFNKAYKFVGVNQDFKIASNRRRIFKLDIKKINLLNKIYNRVILLKQNYFFSILQLCEIPRNHIWYQNKKRSILKRILSFKFY